MSGRFDDALLQEVRDRNNIVAVIGDYVSLKKAGTSWKGLCPFHAEKSPSFTVHEDRQFFYCFGCQTGGDVISFLREINGYSFVEAVRHLAGRAGIDIPEEPADGRRRAGGRGGDGASAPRGFKDACYAMARLAQRFFVDALGAAEGQPCRAYLRERGLTLPTVDRFGLGFAPDRWDGLSTFFVSQSQDLRLAETLGFCVPRQRGGESGGGHYDRFRNRLMFPIRTLSGDIVAYSGRTLSTEKDVAKYVNSPETPVYTKGAMLFGLHEARKAMRVAGHAVLVEGNVDVMRLSQEGVEAVVAPLGTALTEPQCRLLRRFVPQVVLLYDGDRAGQAATIKAIPMALAEGLQVAVVQLPDGEDPDTFVRAQGKEALDALIARALPGWEFLVDAVTAETRARDSQQGKVRAIDALAPVLGRVEDRRERSLYGRHLAEALGLSEAETARFVRDALARLGGAPVRSDAPPPRASAPAAPKVPPPVLELKLLVLLTLAPDASLVYLGHEIGNLLTSERIKRAADALAVSRETEETLNVNDYIAALEDVELRASLLQAMTTQPPPQDWRRDLDGLETALRIEALKRQQHELSQRRRDLSRAGRETDLIQILVEEAKIQEQLNTLKGTRGTRWPS